MKNKFLDGDGEMSALIRAKDWSKTSLGNPETWSQTLRITLSILLNSKFPMFLWWGPELICFYNDAYRPSLGNEGKHPSILGMRAEEAWDEIWDIISPLIDKVVKQGEAIWFEDSLVPIYRNGKIEDVYWTFSYSPVNDETDKIGGVLVTCTETTEKINILKELQESKEELEFAINATELGTWDYNPLTNKFTSNGQLKKWFGLPPENDIELTHAINVMLESDKQRVTEAIQKALQYSSGGNYDIYFTIVHPVTKKETIVHAKGKAWFNEQKIAYRFNGTLEDVTEQISTLKKIQVSQEKLNILIDASELGIFELNLKTDALECSERMFLIFGYDKEEKLDHAAFLNQVHSDDMTSREEAFSNAYKTGILHYESRVMLRDKSVRWIEVKGKVFYDNLSQPDKLIGTVRDITKAKQQQQILSESEQKFRLLADSMPQHIWTADPQGNLNYYNQSVFDYSGLTLEQINKDGWIQIVHPDDREENIKTWIDSVTKGKDFLFEHRFRRYDGVYRWQLSRAIPQKDREGNIQMWVGTSTDIEEQKSFSFELEKLVTERTKMLEENNIELAKMNKELQSFAYISSHDLQEPLRKIQTFSTQIIEKEMYNLSDGGKDKFQRMQKAAQRMQILIDDLLAYSRTNTGERKFEKTDLNKIIDEVKEDLQEDIKEKNAVIETKDLCETNVIPFQFRQLMHNLIGNALKFSRPQQSPHIIIKSEILNGTELKNKKLFPQIQYCHISVSDNGIGFEPEYSERIFEVFQRLHGKDAYNGTGIGLAIVKKIVENHNGIISTKSALNKGATFDIYIPA